MLLRICQWIVDAWAKISVSTIIRSFNKAGIITEQRSSSSKTNLEYDEAEPSVLSIEIVQLLNSDTEEMKNLMDLQQRIKMTFASIN